MNNISKSMSKTIKVCICGKSNKVHAIPEFRFGVMILVIAAVVCFIINVYIGLLFIAIPLASYVVSVIYNIFKGHSIRCSFRKALFDADYVFSSFS